MHLSRINELCAQSFAETKPLRMATDCSAEHVDQLTTRMPPSALVSPDQGLNSLPQWDPRFPRASWLALHG